MCLCGHALVLFGWLLEALVGSGDTRHGAILVFPRDTQGCFAQATLAWVVSKVHWEPLGSCVFVVSHAQQDASSKHVCLF